ncbi:IclR family transcriptional regulator [Pseudomonas sp. N040]|uniref:IclR family transcriptional regulator n=1 Tax=Pseudomonas sp. N040 TaxID=2785325 RepID=UPI0018A2C4DC|nr:IclR family transcriptional regulator [Pseudomonas sp. N040]MBF7729220.1 IclR family transcriptional regulator [Pseudomonas sp. N040]MBW7012860.1 IclR family transcriptional regulator [Pseudomonas sp. N040]
MNQSKPDRLFVTALARGLELLRAFRRGERYLGNGEFASRTGLPKATVNRLTHTLTRLGYLEYQAELGKYCLGAGVLALGYAYLSGLSLREKARPLLAELAAETESSVVLGAREQLHMVCLEICQGHPLFRLNLDVGVRVPHGLTALGRAHLCGMPAAQRDDWLQRYRAESSLPDWAQTEASIRQALRDYQEYGFCYSLGQWNPEVYAVGVPLSVPDGSGSLALSLSGPVFNMHKERLVGELGPRLLALRDRLQGSIGSGR